MLALLLVPILAAASPSDRLVADVKALASAHHKRPVHVGKASKGTFGAAAAGPLALLGAALGEYQTWSEADRKACLEAVGGAGPLGKPCRDALEKHRGAMRRLLDATHAEEAGPPAGLEALADPKAPLQKNGWMLLMHGARLASWELTLQLEAGRADMAVDTCLDALALGRDTAYGTGLVGAMVGAAIHGMLSKPCARAFDAATQARKKSGALQLATIRRGLAPFSLTLRDEAVYGPLSGLGHLLDAKQLARLPANARAIAAGSEPLEDVSAEVARDYWPMSIAFNDALIAAADAPAAQRARRFADARTKLLESENLLARIAPPPDFSKFADRRDLAVAGLDLLAEAIRIDLDWDSLAHPSAGVTAAPAADGKSAKLVVTAAGEEVSLTIHADE